MRAGTQEQSPVIAKVIHLGVGALFVVFCAFVSEPAWAGSITASANVTIDGETGSVGQEDTPTDTGTTTPTTTTTSARQNPANGALRTDPFPAAGLGGVIRPAPEVAPPAPAPTTNGASGAAANEVPTATRLPAGSQKVGNLLGGSGAVAVAGQPNQTFTVSLPGKTVYSTGGSIVTIEGFVHNAGFTPALNGQGGGVFQMGAQLGAGPAGTQGPGPAGAQGSGPAGAAATGDASGAAGPVRDSFAGPVIAISPFINITISYN